MAYLLLVVLLFSVVAAHPDSRKPWQQGPPPGPPFNGPPGNTTRPPMMPNDKEGARPPFGGQPMGRGQENQGPMGRGQENQKPMGRGQENQNQRPMGRGPWRPGSNMGNPDQPMWPKEMPPWFPGSTTGKPGNGDGQQPMGTPNGVTPQPGGPPQNPERGDIQGNDWGSLWGQGVMGGLASPADLSPPFGSGYVAEGSGTQPGQRVPRGPGGRPGRPGKPQRGGRPNTRDPNQRVPPFPGAGGQAPFDGILIGGQPLRPEIVGNREFFPFLKDDNVTIQNVSNIPLKEGENLFLLPGGGQGSPPPMDSPNAPQRQWFGSSYNLQPYLKLIYNPTATRKVSFEYGLTTLLPFG